ncbi:MAG: HNH endonuclease signature motif containing protein [Aquabacterium sp.]
MEDLIYSVLAHNPDNRGVDRQKLENSGLRAEKDTTGVMNLAVHLLSNIAKCSEEKIARELAEKFSYRLLFLLLPEECLFGAPERDKPLISAHLESMGIPPRPDIVSAVKFLIDNFRSKTRSEQKKTTITDVYVKYPKIYTEILGRQCGRCAVCGSSLIYGVNMQLDHVLPWHLGDDPSDGSNWQFLCEVCNRGKGMLPHYSLAALQSNWIKPGLSHTLGEDVRYAALKRDGVCALTGKGPTQVELEVVKKFETGCWVLDNVRAIEKRLANSAM